MISRDEIQEKVDIVKRKIEKNKKNSKKGLHFLEDYYIIPIVANEVAKTKHKGLSPNGKATDSDSVSSRFESL